MRVSWCFAGAFTPYLLLLHAIMPEFSKIALNAGREFSSTRTLMMCTIS